MTKAVADHSNEAGQWGTTPADLAVPDGETGAEDVAASFDEWVGRQLGPYLLEARLGGGAMAVVYRAIDLDSETPVAVKVLNPSADAVLRERFRVEARTVRTLDHPNIVRTLSAGQSEDGLTYIAMEMVEGDSLSTWLEQRHKISVFDACRLLAPIARALVHAHAKGIVHRDVKPSNILLRRVPVGTAGSIPLNDVDYAVIPLLSDFGIARALDAPELTAAGRTIGTPAYMSPEQCAGTRELDGRADIYAMGAVLYRCLVGRPPFVGATTQILHAHVYESLTIPEVVAQALPGTMLEILRQALQKEPADRYRDAARLATDLDQIIQQVIGPTKPVADSTLTMPILLAAPPAESVATHVLVAGVGNAPARPMIPWVPPASTATKSTNVHSITANRRPPRTARRRSNWLVIGVGLFVSVVLVGLGALAITTILPLMNPSPSISSDPPTLNANTIVPTPVTPSGTAISTPTTTLSAAVGGPNQANLTVTVPFSPGLTTNRGLTPTLSMSGGQPLSNTVAPSVTGALSSTAALDVENTWSDVEHYHRIGDWGLARFFLIEILAAEGQLSTLQHRELTPSAQAKLAYQGMMSLSDERFWLPWQGVFSRAEMQQILADSYIGAANSQVRANKLVSATVNLEAARAVQPESPVIATLADGVAGYAVATPVLRTLAADRLVDAYVAYARERAVNDAYCAAADTLVTATGIAPNPTLTEEVNNYQKACEAIRGTSSTASPLSIPGGQLFYSTQEGDDYRIYRTTVPTATVPTATNTVLVVDGGSLPSVFGTSLAFYSRRAGEQGLSGINWLSGRLPTDSFRRYTAASEDAADSPPRWNTRTNELVFASKDSGDRKPHIYITSASFDDLSKRDLGSGEDPAWSPDGTQIIYSYVGPTGNEAGLWLMTSNGEGRQRLTTGEDRRPIWSLDGRYIIFMRKISTSDWDVLRLELATNALVPLSAPGAQDGLPALSPDGTFVAFASDRDGRWNIYAVPLAGGDVTLLMSINGVMLNWLEHGIQWVN